MSNISARLPKIFVTAIVSAFISVFAIVVAPAALPAQNTVAYAQSAEDLMEEVRALRSRVDSAKSEYLSATQVVEQLSAQQSELQTQMEQYDGDIAAKRAKLADIVVREYKSPTAASFIQALGEAGSLDEALKQYEYVNKVVEDRARVLREIDELTEAAQENMEALEMKKSEGQSAALAAEAAQAAFNEELVAMKPQLKKIREEYLAAVANSTGNAQLEAAMTYLEDVDGITDVQADLLRSAYRTGYAGGDRCESWTEAVYRNAGYSIDRYIGAAQCAAALTKSNDLDTIPVGALVFGSGSGSYMGQRYGHVGICVASGTGNGDALIIDNEGSRTKTAVLLKEWSEWQVSVSWVSGKQGAFAWGYPDSVELSPVEL